MNSNYENTDKTMTTTTTNYDAETNTSDIEKIKDLREQNFEGEVNNKQLNKEDTQRSNLKSKYLSLTLVLNT